MQKTHNTPAIHSSLWFQMTVGKIRRAIDMETNYLQLQCAQNNPLHFSKARMKVVFLQLLLNDLLPVWPPPFFPQNHYCTVGLDNECQRTYYLMFKEVIVIAWGMSKFIRSLICSYAPHDSCLIICPLIRQRCACECMRVCSTSTFF